jgi:hypothetical protein
MIQIIFCLLLHRLKNCSLFVFGCFRKKLLLFEKGLVGCSERMLAFRGAGGEPPRRLAPA